MKRSEVNQYLNETRQFFARHGVQLPPFASFSPQKWLQVNPRSWQEVFDLKLGWDITDFGGGDFLTMGLTLFTLRNGSPEGAPYAKSYAEKVMHVRDNQMTPMHFHWSKQEDIINRGGGNLIVELWQSDPFEQPDETDITVVIDGCRQTHAAGSQLRLSPGESISLVPEMYHSFWGEPGYGDVLVGEVSMVNDDDHDNRFLKPLERFSTLTEDIAPALLLCHEYRQFI
ncbi:D-lyxose/D-mannose family sugar isomerase [Cedecea neteri]|uniref:D-lyxose/D-mannose isomerase n=1 Tax=Cedecea neteri TaxID=158822 RepID=UPI0004F809DA|nr:D-lyxose/D-mannose family sugar isomerase [Cedecea neteri]AIR64808.1 sugar ABC transporter [Cedecea neteri]